MRAIEVDCPNCLRPAGRRCAIEAGYPNQAVPGSPEDWRFYCRERISAAAQAREQSKRVQRTERPMSNHYPLSIDERRKLVTALAEARRALEVAAPYGPLPSGDHADRFRDYSSAMCNLATHCLSTAEWVLEHWSWDGHRQEFYFDYAGRCQLARSDQHRDYDLMLCRARMSLDPAKDLEGELARLGTLAARYRERVEHLEVETLRAYIYPEGEPARGRPADAQPRPAEPGAITATIQLLSPEERDQLAAMLRRLLGLAAGTAEDGRDPDLAAPPLGSPSPEDEGSRP